eukprot:13615008-Alexandrium_andersonii.AAC.1
MSASLVGSEMCIRDRLRGLPLQPSWPPALRWLALPGLLARQSGGWPGPVSYTHLTLPTICSV